VAALIGPALILLTGVMAPFDLGVSFPDYGTLLAFARHPLGKLALLAVIALFLWHGAERACLTLRDMRVGPGWLLSWATYGIAGLGSLITLSLLLAIGF